MSAPPCMARSRPIAPLAMPLNTRVGKLPLAAQMWRCAAIISKVPAIAVTISTALAKAPIEIGPGDESQPDRPAVAIEDSDVIPVHTRRAGKVTQKRFITRPVIRGDTGILAGDSPAAGQDTEYGSGQHL